MLLEIANKHNKSVAQVVLRWLIQQGIIIIPKTWDEIHLKENIELEDFELSEGEMAVIDGMDKGEFLNYHPDRLLYTMPKKYQGWTGF